jgi:hypothetical protein
MRSFNDFRGKPGNGLSLHHGIKLVNLILLQNCIKTREPASLAGSPPPHLGVAALPHRQI